MRYLANGGGSSCIEGWDGISRDVNPIALVTNGGGSGCICGGSGDSHGGGGSGG
jgi:hypothetical protein